MPKGSRCHSIQVESCLRSSDAQDPALHTGQRALGGCQARLQERRKLPGAIGFTNCLQYKYLTLLDFLAGYAGLTVKSTARKLRLGAIDGDRC